MATPPPPQKNCMMENVWNFDIFFFFFFFFFKSTFCFMVSIFLTFDILLYFLVGLYYYKNNQRNFLKFHMFTIMQFFWGGGGEP